MDQSWSIERLMSQKTVNPEYYDAAAAMAHPRRFPSPVNDPDWLLPAASWFTEGQTCLEIGPGRGEFAKAALLCNGRMKKYHIVDMSSGMLDLVRARIKEIDTDVMIEFIHADIDKDPLAGVPDQSVDRIIMINVFQDLQPLNALRHLRRIMSPDGLLRANMSNREIRDSLRTDDEFFDKKTGCYYMTRPPLEEKQKDISPLGFVDKDGIKVPFYRILKSYYPDQMRGIFRKCGFEIIQETPMILPKKIWMESNEGRLKERMDPIKSEIIEKFGGYPGKMDVIATPI